MNNYNDILDEQIKQAKQVIAHERYNLSLLEKEKANQKQGIEKWIGHTFESSSQTTDEFLAFYNEANTIFSGIGGLDPITDISTNSVANVANANSYSTGRAMDTALAEVLGSSGAASFGEMALSIDSFTVNAKSRAIKGSYSTEMAQDMYSIHGLNMEAEISNILATEVLAEINRESIRTVYIVATPGCQWGTTTQTVFDLDTDSKGRHLVERFNGLVFQIRREAAVIAKQTRMGRGNILIVSADVAIALSMCKEFNYNYMRHQKKKKFGPRRMENRRWAG